MRKGALSLKKSAFIRLCLITFAAVLVFYIIGLTVNAIGIQNVREDMSAALNTVTNFTADELGREFDNLNFFMLELMSDKQLTRFAIAYDIIDDYDRLTHVKTLSQQEFMIRRSSGLVASVQIMLPGLNRTITTDQALYDTLDAQTCEALLAGAPRNQVTLREWRDRLWMLLPNYDRSEPLFLIAIEITPEAMLRRLERVGGDRAEGMLLLREDGSVFAGNETGLACREAELAGGRDGNTLTAEAALPMTPLTLRCYDRVNQQLRPFVSFRVMLWVLTLLALGLMAFYLMYYRVNIMRPLNDIFDTMRQSGRDGRYRIELTKGGDYDDIYAQFNDMVDHIEALAGQVYEARYRAQKAELMQLQMQIDPHFLYNSLYLIYRIARTEGNESIAKLSLNLSNYYRYITKMPEQVVLLQDEINHVMNYLEIQRIRFEPRIRIEVEPLPEEIANERIPSLIIQPVVENAFQHGVKDRTEGGLVSMRYACEDDCFRVIVSDNSGRMDEAKIAALWALLKSDADDSASALRNLYRRLLIYEDSGHELDLKCVDGGLTVILSFRRRGGGT